MPNRELRMVPPTWKHPVDKDDYYIPLFDGARYLKDIEKYNLACSQWKKGLCERLTGEWVQVPPGSDPEYDEEESVISSRYGPSFTKEEATHFMFYEVCSEGTPLSPAFETIPELAKWLSDNKGSYLADWILTEENWLIFLTELEKYIVTSS